MDLFPIFITLILVILALIVLFKRGHKKPPMVKNKGNAVFIMGECAAGKTALLYSVILQKIMNLNSKNIQYFNKRL